MPTKVPRNNAYITATYPEDKMLTELQYGCICPVFILFSKQCGTESLFW